MTQWAVEAQHNTMVNRKRMCRHHFLLLRNENNPKCIVKNAMKKKQFYKMCVPYVFNRGENISEFGPKFNLHHIKILYTPKLVQFGIIEFPVTSRCTYA